MNSRIRLFCLLTFCYLFVALAVSQAQEIVSKATLSISTIPTVCLDQQPVREAPLDLEVDTGVTGKHGLKSMIIGLIRFAEPVK